MFTPYAVLHAQRLGEGLSLRCMGFGSERDFAVAGVPVAGPGGEPAGAPVLYACDATGWRAPMPLEGVAEVTGVARAAAGAWHVVGHADGRGVLLTCWPATGHVERWPIDSAPLHAAATDPEGVLFAVGAGGFAFRKKEGHPVLERVLTHRALTVAAVDPTGTCWTAATGRIVRRPAAADGATWTPVWSSADWTSPFVSIAALSRMVVCAAEDGLIVVGRQGA
jgi:hypothetical protein